MVTSHSNKPIFKIEDFPLLDGWRSVGETARILGLTQRAVRGFVADGVLTGCRVFKMSNAQDGILIPVEEVYRHKKLMDSGQVKRGHNARRSLLFTEDQYRSLRQSGLNARRLRMLANIEPQYDEIQIDPGKKFDFYHREFAENYRKWYNPEVFYAAQKTYIFEYRDEQKYFELLRARRKWRIVERRFLHRKRVENLMHFPHVCGGWWRIVPHSQYLWALQCDGCNGTLKLPRELQEELTYFSYGHVLRLNKAIDDMLKAA